MSKNGCHMCRYVKNIPTSYWHSVCVTMKSYALCVSMCRYIQFQSKNTCTYMQFMHMQTYLYIPAIQAHTYNTCNSDIPSHTCNTWSYLHICRYLHTCNTYKFLQIPAYTGRYLLPYYIPTTITIYQHIHTIHAHTYIPNTYEYLGGP